MPYTFTEEVVLIKMECRGCGIPFAVPKSFDERNRESGGKWYCPNGHNLVYTEPEVDKLKQQLAAARAHATHADDQRLAAERRTAAVRGQMTKLKKRAANGVCPCCHRTFQQLARHMANKHPDYEASE